VTKRRLIWATAIAAVALVAWLVLRSDGGSEGAAPGEPEIVSVEELVERSNEAGAPIYWLGERDGVDYELTETESGQVYVRYLPQGAEAGDPRTDFDIVGTYPAPDAVAALRRGAREAGGARLARTDDGAALLVDPAESSSAHLAYPGADVQIEIYSGVPGRALRLAARGEVQPVP
jgi:hypothetical protein